jgi:hypothetical protein
LIRLLLYLWAAPNSLLGLLLVPLALAGGQVRRCRGTLEASGGGLKWLLRPFAEAITLGHVILARRTATLDRWRAHERRHVRQYEVWGPLFIPAYVVASLWCWLRGRRPYLDNPFERQACLAKYARKQGNDRNRQGGLE